LHFVLVFKQYVFPHKKNHLFLVSSPKSGGNKKLNQAITVMTLEIIPHSIFIQKNYLCLIIKPQIQTSMKKIMTLLAFALCTAGITSAQSANEQTLTPEQAAMMKKWTAYMTPGEFHSMLAKSNGEWNEDIIMWMDPSGPPTKSTGSASNSMILGGRYQQSMHHGSINGMPFEGMNLLGYDNEKKVFQSSWIDNMGTGIMTMEGTYDPTTMTMTLKGHQVDPMTSKETDVRETFKIENDNSQLMTMYATPAGGKEYKSMEIRFTRTSKK
jgi:hypothetical protein